MKKNILLFIICLTTLTTFAQDCGFDSSNSEKESNKKMDWFVKELPKQKMVVTNDKNNIPKQVLKQLKCYLNGFDIANPDEEHQSGCGSDGKTPSRHLTLLAKNKNYIVISYNTYNLGIASYHIWIRYNKDGITDFWSTSIGGGLIVDSKFDILNYYTHISSRVKELNKFLTNRS